MFGCFNSVKLISESIEFKLGNFQVILQGSMEHQASVWTELEVFALLLRNWARICRLLLIIAFSSIMGIFCVINLN